MLKRKIICLIGVIYMGIREVIKARETAESLNELILAEAPSQVEQSAAWRKFWETLSSIVPEEFKRIAVEPFKPMNAKERILFGIRPFPFGLHKEKLLIDVPEDYLLFLVENQEFIKEIERYLMQ